MTGSSSSKGEKGDGIKAFQVIDYRDMNFENPHPDVHVAKILIANASWINTTDGTVVVDTLMFPKQGQQMKKKIEESGGSVKYIIYTHGHMDHVGGAAAFLDDKPEIIGQRLLPDRLENYRILSEHRARISAIQFNLPFRPESQLNFVEPTRTYDESMVLTLGDKTFELYHARAETDDATWIYIPEINTVFAGDLIISGLPNIGNPWKPTRFALPWARALEAVRAKKPNMLIAHGGNAVYKGEEVKELLDVTIEAIYSLHDQVVECINADMHITEMIHTIELPDHLKSHRYLTPVYSRPEFAVYNIYRWYHGYFDHNPANLLPSPKKEVSTEIYGLIGDPESILKRARELLKEGRAQLGLEVLDVLIQADPENTDAHRLRIEILEELGANDYCLMSRNTWVYFIERDREFLRSKGAL